MEDVRLTWFAILVVFLVLTGLSTLILVVTGSTFVEAGAASLLANTLSAIVWRSLP